MESCSFFIRVEEFYNSLSFKNMFKLLFIMLIISVFGILSCKFSYDDINFYYLFIGTNSEGFENDLAARAAGKKINGEVFIYLNGNLISYYSGYGLVIQINQWIKPKENTLWIKGTSSEDLYIKIASYKQNGDDFKVLFKKRLISGYIEASGTFYSEIHYNLPLFNYSISNDPNLIRNEVKNKILSLRNDIDNRQIEKVINQLSVGPSIWQPMAYNVNWSANKNTFKDQVIDQILSENKKIIDFNDQDIKIIIGKNSIYTFTGISNDQIPAPYIFKLFDNDTIKYLPAIKFFRFNNKWEIWQ